MSMSSKRGGAPLGSRYCFFLLVDTIKMLMSDEMDYKGGSSKNYFLLEWTDGLGFED